MNAVSYEALECVLIDNDYRFLRVVTEHVFELCRGETSRFTIRRTPLNHVRSAAHFVASSLNLIFKTYPPTKADVSEGLKLLRIAEFDGPTLIELFRETVVGHGELVEEVDETFRSFGHIRWAVRLVDEWNWRSGVCQTDTELIYLAWFTTA
jgi:hypothetical protein